MEPGLWEVSVQLEVPGNAVAMPPITQTLCFTREDIESGTKALPQESAGNLGNCRPDNLSIGGNTASWTLNCDQMTGSGRMTYSGDSYSGTADIEITMDGASQRMKQTFSGRRLGDCRE